MTGHAARGENASNGDNAITEKAPAQMDTMENSAKDSNDNTGSRNSSATLAPPSTQSLGTAAHASHLATHNSTWQRIVSKLAWVPPRCRYDPVAPPKFTMTLNFVYAFTACFTVASLYWNQPVLNKIAESFDVTYERASTVATLMQSGYAGGLLFICPAGDMVRRRPFILAIISATALMWIGLCITQSFPVFQALSFLCGFTTVTPQLMLPLVGDIAPVHRKASSISIVVSGLMLGMLVARLLSGIVGNYTDWRNIYWFAFGVQVIVVVLLFWTMPDYPSTNPSGLGYGAVLVDIAKLLATQPLLVQSCIVGFCMSAVFTSFWTTLTFLLSSPPYDYQPLTIGLFALIGIVAIAGGPVYGRLLTDHMAPWYSTAGGVVISMASGALSTGISTFSVAGPIIHAFGLDIGQQISQVANRTAIFSINPKARNRINTAYMLSAFCGQLTGTAVGNRLYAQGGWRLSAGCSLAFAGLALLALAAKGPRSPGWIGWGGSWRLRLDHESEPERKEASVEDGGVVVAPEELKAGAS